MRSSMHSGTLCVQIIPSIQVPDSLSPHVQTALRPSDEREGSLEQCDVCKGEGRLYHGEECRKCGGQGEGYFIRATRIFIRPGSDFGLDEGVAHEVRKLLLRLGPKHRVERNVLLKETGGGRTSTGYCTIACGLKGEKLTSWWGRAASNSVHAVFWVHAALFIEYSQHRGKGKGAIWLVGVDRRAPQHIGVQWVKLWSFTDEGKVEELTKPFLRHNRQRGSLRIEFPTEAVESAKVKARIYHCRRAVYAIGHYASGPSGALRGAGAAYGGLPSPLKGPGIRYEPKW